jgi:hypothetical protein
MYRPRCTLCLDTPSVITFSESRNFCDGVGQPAASNSRSFGGYCVQVTRDWLTGITSQQYRPQLTSAQGRAPSRTKSLVHPEPETQYAKDTRLIGLRRLASQSARRDRGQSQHLRPFLLCPFAPITLCAEGPCHAKCECQHWIADARSNVPGSLLHPLLKTVMTPRKKRRDDHRNRQSRCVSNDPRPHRIQRFTHALNVADLQS